MSDVNSPACSLGSVAPTGGAPPQQGPNQLGPNPFATRWVRPGRIAYRLPTGTSLRGLLVKLQESAWCGEITGPHGSGKSTLLQALEQPFEEAGRQVVTIAVRGGQRRLPLGGREVASWNASTQVVVDGYEQLWLPSRRWIQRACKRQRAGLLVTTHQPMGFPLLWRTSVAAGTAKQLAMELLAGYPALITEDDVEQQWRFHSGNLREAFFGLYDLYDQRCRQGSRSAVQWTSTSM